MFFVADRGVKCYNVSIIKKERVVGMTDSEKLDLILNKMDNLENKIDRLEEKVDRLEERVARLEEKVDRLEEKVDRLEERVDCIENDVRDIKLTLENEIRTNIQRVAEGHLDLSRNLHEVMKPNNEIEMLAVKVSMLETDVRELKRKIS